MEELHILGAIYVIVGLVLSLLLAIALIFTLVGIIFLFIGKKGSSTQYTRYPMFITCPSCGRQVEVGSTMCPHCNKPIM